MVVRPYRTPADCVMSAVWKWFCFSLLPQVLPIDHLDRPGVRIEVLQTPSIHLNPELAGDRALCLLIPHRRAQPCAAATNRTVVVFYLISTPLVGRDPIARRGQHEVFFRIPLGTEGTGAASHNHRP